MKTPATVATLEAFKQRWELFRVSCDHAEELVESLRQRIGSECLVDEATGSSFAPAALGIKPISAVRLEQMSKAVRCLVIELQQGADGGSAPPAGAGSRGRAESMRDSPRTAPSRVYKPAELWQQTKEQNPPPKKHNCTMVFTLKEMEQTTNMFSERSLIGKGRFGHVYRGVLKHG